MNPPYANPQGIEPSFDISHERIKGEQNHEHKRKQSIRQKATTQSTILSTASSEKHVVASVLLILNSILFWFLIFNCNLLSDL